MYSSIRSLFSISSSESISVATSCSPRLTSASGLSSSLSYYKTIQTEMASSLDPLPCDAIEPDARTFIPSSRSSILQLQLLSCMELNGCNSGSRPHFHDIHKHFRALPSPQVMLLPEVAKFVKFVLLMPATNAVSERSASAMRRIKTYLRSTMTQSRLTNVILLHIHNHDHTATLNEFASADDDRRKQFGVFH